MRRCLFCDAAPDRYSNGRVAQGHAATLVPHF